MSRIVVEGNKLILEFSDPDAVSKFIEILKLLGVTNNITERKIIIKYDPNFELYLRNDKKYQKRTVKDYMNYLKKLDGEAISYNLYLKISGKKWYIKTVRLYLDYLYKNNRISWEEYQKYLYIFKVKGEDNVNNVKVDPEELILPIYDERSRSVEILLFRVLLYSGIRFSEAVKLLNEFSEDKLVCFEDRGFCRYGLLWKRGKKRVDWVFMPKDLIPELEMFRGYYKGRDPHNVQRVIEKKHRIKLGWFRKFFYRVCRSIADKELCDFYQGRIGKLSTGDKHYDELLSKCDELYPDILKEIKKIIDQVLTEMSDGYPIEVLHEEPLEEDIEDDIESDIWEYSIEEA